jgi:tetratricopeptide (TPR) repeat protein
MEIREKRDLYRQVIASVTAKQLVPGFAALRRLSGRSASESLLADLDGDEEIYRQMLRYFIMDAPDPQREQLRDDLSRKLLHLADTQFARSLSPPNASHWYQFRYRFENATPFRQPDLAMLSDWMDTMPAHELAEYEPRLERIFCGIWMCTTLPASHLEILSSFLLHEEGNAHLKTILVSALILHLLEKFSEEPWMLLADIYLSQTPQLWQRALLGMLLTLIRFDHRMYLYPNIAKRILLLTEDPLFVTHLEKTAIQIIRTGDTEKVSRRVQEEIIPEMMKIAPKIQEKLSLDQMIQDEAGDEKNPEWEKFFEDSPGMYEKMEELNQLQLEGADLFISTFSRLKNFPFFQHAVNWFFPFHHKHPALQTHFTGDEINTKIRDFLSAFENFPIMCNSDKYSFSFNLSAMPEMQRNMLMNTLSGEVTEMIRQNSEESLLDESKGLEVFHQFAQDLYRFFRVHPARNETEDPFALRKQLYRCSSMEPVLEAFPGLARRIGEYYFQQEHYTHAISLFSFSEKTPQDSPELFQKIAFAWQMTGDLNKALDYYRKAELFDSNALWNLRKIAWIHQLQNNIPDALRAYKDAERLNPDSVQIKLSIGNLYLQIDDWANALTHYRKAEELSPASEKTLRPMAWCLFLQGELLASAHYYEQIMEREYNHNDLLNYGHVLFASGDKEKALRYYLEGYNHRNSNPVVFTEAFRSDMQHLERLGITQEDASFMLDSVLLRSN